MEMVDLLTVVTSELYIDYHMPTVRLKEPFFQHPLTQSLVTRITKNVNNFIAFREMCIIFLQYQYIAHLYILDIQTLKQLEHRTPLCKVFTQHDRTYHYFCI